VKDLEIASQPYPRCREVLYLVERRETSMRLSPLLLIVSMGKGIGIVRGKQQRHQDVANCF
jgi:hypothetical protein